MGNKKTVRWNGDAVLIIVGWIYVISLISVLTLFIYNLIFYIKENRLMDNNCLAYHCTIYIAAEKDETETEATERLERILRDVGLDFQCYDTELRKE